MNMIHLHIRSWHTDTTLNFGSTFAAQDNTASIGPAAAPLHAHIPEHQPSSPTAAILCPLLKNVSRH